MEPTADESPGLDDNRSIVEVMQDRRGCSIECKSRQRGITTRVPEMRFYASLERFSILCEIMRNRSTLFRRRLSHKVCSRIKSCNVTFFFSERQFVPRRVLDSDVFNYTSLSLSLYELFKINFLALTTFRDSSLQNVPK